MKKFNAKKLIAGLSSAALIAGTMPTVTIAAQAAEEPSTLMYGDANLDGKVTVADAVAILQFIGNKDKYNLSEQGKDNGDVFDRGDGITAKDALSIQKYSAKLINELPESWLNQGDPDPQTTTTTATTPSQTTTTTTTEVTPVTDIIYITLNGTSISVTGDNSGYTSVSGSTVTISHSGTYYVSGTLDDGQINVNIPDETADAETVKIFLNGASITGKSDSAILITNAENTSINLVDGTTNTITDGDTAYASGNAVIEAKDDLTIKGGTAGTGVLNLTANTQNGIVCNNDIKINGGVINIETLNATDKTNGINGKTSLTVKDGTLTVDAEGDGIKSGKGSVAISGGDVSIKAGNDAIQAETTIDISGGTVNAGGDRGLTAVTGVNITGGTVVATATDNQADSALLSGTTQNTWLFNCIEDSTNTTWKKANSFKVGDLTASFNKKYLYVLISDASLTGTKTITNTSTGAVVTHTNDTAESFTASGTVTTFNTVNPAGKDGGSTSTDPVTTDYTITLNGTSIQSNAPTDVASVNGSVLTISKEGVFAVSGDASEVQIVVDVDKNAYPNSVVELDLTGASITNSTTAPIYVASIGDEVQIVAKSGTTNTISDGTSHTQTYTDSDGNTNTVEGAIFARDDIKFKGTGTLNVNGNEADAIVCKNDIKIYNGTINVTAVDDGIRGKDSVTIGNDTATDYSSLNLTVKSTSGDGIKSTATDTATASKTYGLITINGGTVDINSYGDGIQAEQEFVMNGGDVNIYTYVGSGFTSSGSTSTGSTGSTDPWSSGRQGGGGFGGGGMGQDGNSNKTDISAKGIKAVGLYDAAGTTWQSGGNITINGGNLTVNSSDDCVHCGGDMKLIGGNLLLETADDGCHSDHALTIGQGSATTYDDIVIRITKGYEGIEAQQIVQNSGAVIVNVTDDGYNAGGGSDGSGNTAPGGSPFGQGGFGGGSSGNYSITFNGGFGLVNVASGDHDGFDSNGSITINDGIWVTNGNEPFDSDSGVTTKGGVYIENSQSNGNYMDAQPNYSVTGSSASQGQRISLVGSNGQVIVSFIAGKAVSTLRAGGNVSGASFKIGGTLNGATYFMDGEQAAYGGTIS